MTSPASDELTEAFDRLHDERETLLRDIGELERDLADRRKALTRIDDNIEAMEKTLALLGRAPDTPRDDADEPYDDDEDEDADSEAIAESVAESAPPAVSAITPASAPPAPEAPDFSGLSRQVAVLGIITGAMQPLHYKEIADIVGAPPGSVTPNLSQLKQRELVETREPGVYELAQRLSLTGEHEANEALREVATAIVDEQRWDVLDAVYEMDKRLPFVGFEHFRRNRLPTVAGVREWANDRLTHAIMKDMLARDLIEVYHTENPRNPEFPTAAIRLTDEGFEEIER